MQTYHMQKAERELNHTGELNEILRKGRYASIALSRDDEPYVVTLSYGYDAEGACLFFHTALKGLKNEFIAVNPRACATIVEDLGYRPGKCTHAYRSVVLWGKMTRVDDLAEKKHGVCKHL